MEEILYLIYVKTMLYIYMKDFIFRRKKFNRFHKKKIWYDDDDSDREKYYIPKKYNNEIFNISVKELKDFKC